MAWGSSAAHRPRRRTRSSSRPGRLTTTGADLLVAAVGYYDAGLTGGITMDVSDSKGNTWTPLTVYVADADASAVRLY